MTNKLIEEVVKNVVCKKIGVHTCRLGRIHLNERETSILEDALTTLLESERKRIEKVIRKFENNICRFLMPHIDDEYAKDWLRYTLTELTQQAEARGYEAGKKDREGEILDIVEDVMDWYNLNNPIPDDMYTNDEVEYEKLTTIVRNTRDELKQRILSHLKTVTADTYSDKKDEEMHREQCGGRY